jgi:hypothetical protein
MAGMREIVMTRAEDILLTYFLLGLFTTFMLVIDILLGGLKYKDGLNHILKMIIKDIWYWIIALIICVVFWPVSLIIENERLGTKAKNYMAFARLLAVIVAVLEGDTLEDATRSVVAWAKGSFAGIFGLVVYAAVCSLLRSEEFSELWASAKIKLFASAQKLESDDQGEVRGI